MSFPDGDIGRAHLREKNTHGTAFMGGADRAGGIATRLRHFNQWLNNSVVGDALGALCLFGGMYLGLFLELLV